MYLPISTWFFFLGGTLATRISIGENQNLHVDLKTCLSTVIEKLCPDCITVHLVIQTKLTWEVDHFFDSTRMYAMTISSIDRLEYEDLMFDQVGLYPVNTEANLNTVLNHLREAKIKGRSYIVLVNFQFGRNLGSYLRKMIPATWKGGNASGVIFVALIGSDVQVYGTPIRKSGTISAKSFRELSVCDRTALIQVSQPLAKVIKTKKSIARVALVPALLPYVERKTDNPGGFIGEYMKVLTSKLDFIPKYNWSVTARDMEDFVQGDELRMAFNLFASPKKLTRYSSMFLISEGVWMISTANSFGEPNIFAIDFTYHIFLHLTLLIVYISVMVYLSEDLDKSRLVLRLLGMFFGISVGWLPKKALFRFMVIVWCFTTYILLQVYLAKLTSRLTSAVTSAPFHDTDGLMASGIDLFCAPRIKAMYCDMEGRSSVYICKKCMIPDSGWISRHSTDRLYTNESWKPFASSIDVQIFNSYFAGKSMTLMQERIGFWPAELHTNLDVKVYNKTADFTERLFEAGIPQRWLYQYSIKNITNMKPDHELLTMSHLGDVFIILYVGWACSFVVFVIELLTKWYHNNYTF